MANVEIYTKPTCPFCIRAKALLDQRSVAYQEIDVSNNPSLQQAMAERADGRYTVPQIFIDNVGIGGCDDLHALDANGKLTLLLQPKEN